MLHKEKTNAKTIITENTDDNPLMIDTINSNNDKKRLTNKSVLCTLLHIESTESLSISNNFL